MVRIPRSAAVAALILAAAIEPAGTAQSELPAVGPLLDAYRAGGFESAVEPLAAAPDAEAVRAAFIAGADAWMAREPGDPVQRRLVATAFAVELAHARLIHDNLSMVVLLEWAEKQWRTGPPSAAERLWTHAAVALVERGGRFYLRPRRGDRAWGDSFITRAARRFSDDVRLQLARAVFMLNGFDRGTLERLARDPVVGPDALLRLAFLAIDKQCDTTLRLARDAAARAREAAALYVAHFLMASCHEMRGRPGEAAAAYQAALRAVPHAQSASLALALLLALDDQGEAAFELVDRSLAEHPMGDDPWRLFYYGGYVRWPLVIADLRQAIR